MGWENFYAGEFFGWGRVLLFSVLIFIFVLSEIDTETTTGARVDAYGYATAILASGTVALIVILFQTRRQIRDSFLRFWNGVCNYATLVGHICKCRDGGDDGDDDFGEALMRLHVQGMLWATDLTIRPHYYRAADIVNNEPRAAPTQEQLMRLQPVMKKLQVPPMQHNFRRYSAAMSTAAE